MPLTFSLPSPCSRGSGAASHRERRTSEGSRPDIGGTPHSPRSRRASSRIGPETPENAYLAIGGDYNTQHHNEECLATLSSVVVASGPYPADQAGNVNTNAGRSRPYDRILVNSALNALHVPSVAENRPPSHRQHFGRCKSPEVLAVARSAAAWPTPCPLSLSITGAPAGTTA